MKTEKKTMKKNCSKKLQRLLA